jgi:hypothetical protein
MTIIDKKPRDRKVTNKCTECGRQLPRYHPHHYLCQECWEKKQFEKGRAGYVVWSDRKKMLDRGKII